MVDERENRYDGEEGEYHFSDEQINYEELEVTKTSQAAVASKLSILSKLSDVSSRRRIVLAGIVFLFLIGIVYKMLSPSSPSAAGDIQQLKAAAKSPSTQKLTPTMANQQAMKPLVPVTEPMQPTEIQQQGQMQAQAQAVSSAGMMAPPPAPLAEQPVVIPAPPPAPTVDSATLDNRLKTVEEQNAAVMNLLQTEYAQKMSDFETQSTLVRNKIDEVTKRINRIETSLNQITQLLQQGAGPRQQAAMMDGGVPAVARGPKVTYTVQAIIPGRAWLKTDGGDTVTVAEGDILRGFGRITKIDPYDGVVEIDTGNKMVALSYGMSGE